MSEQKKDGLRCCFFDCTNTLEDPYTFGCAIARKQIEDDMDNDTQQEDNQWERQKQS